MSGWSPAAEELRTARLSLRGPTEGDTEAISEIHRSPTCAHKPFDALTWSEEAEALHRRWHDQWQRYDYGN
jgi:RimJ/RimL family protein N-acetyltransferase